VPLASGPRTRNQFDVPLVHSFAPIARRDARVLVLGSMPGELSLAAGRYYAHPHNAFWPIVGAVCGFDPSLAYAKRLAALRARGIALWDVLQSCERDGSLDGDIAASTMRANDFAAFFAAHPRIAAVLCNGGTAHSLFTRRVQPALRQPARALPCTRLPSTSPANAGTTRAAKLRAWRDALAPHLP
jgi:hypoxanthine-DNA glycosylase